MLWKQRNSTLSFQKSHAWIVFWGILLCYAILILPTVGRLGIGWDEATDLVIAQAYATPKGMLLGTDWDPSQTRLPMFLVALVFRVLGTDNLLIARFATVFVGGLTLLGLFVYGRDRFTTAIGLLAAGLLAINPFFLAFARQAFTESDIYLACALVWLLVAFSRFQKGPSVGWAVLSGIVLSLAISSKATALAIIPVVCVSFLLSQAFSGGSNTSLKLKDVGVLPARSIWFWCGWATVSIFAGVLVSRQIDTGSGSRIFHLLNYGLASVGWLIMIIWSVRYRNYTTDPIALSVFIACISIWTFIIFPPEHLGNSGIIGALITRANTELVFSPGFMLELAALHIFSIFLKSTPILGFGLLAGLIGSFLQWRRHELTLPLLIAATYFLVVLTLPLGQTFYTVPLLPILSLFVANQLSWLWLKHRTTFLAFVFVGLVWWGVEIRQCYPDYHLNGYQWVGERPLFGRSSIGYRSIVFVPLDGSQQVMEWLNTHAESDEIVQLYVGPKFIVELLAPKPAYQISYGSIDNLDVEPDYVAIQIGSTIWTGNGNDTPQGDIFRYPFNLDVLQREYEKVFSVRRAFDLEVASVWKRK